MTSLATEQAGQAPACAGTPAPRPLAAVLLSSLIYTLLWPVAAAKSPGVFRTLGRRAMVRLVTAFAPRAGRRRARSGRPATRVEPRPEPRWTQLLVGTTTTVMTVVIVDDWEVRWDATAVVNRLAELAVNDELIVVCGSNERTSGPDAPIVTNGLRNLLPRHDVVALHIAAGTGAEPRSAALVGELLEIGSLPVVVTSAGDVREVAERLFVHLGADRILKLSCTTGAADLYHVSPGATAVGSRSTCLTPTL